ncbi:MAG: hypothetical protein FWH22_10500 [Fibromonadales bacterium]|nr:hypothetical protein [Fibromonadales bacterium]
MSKKSGIDPTYYENNCFADDFMEAKKNGTLIIAKPDESTIEVIKRKMLAKKKSETVSMRLPKPLRRFGFCGVLIIYSLSAQERKFIDAALAFRSKYSTTSAGFMDQSFCARLSLCSLMYCTALKFSIVSIISKLPRRPNFQKFVAVF